jgi:cytidylate kinase
VEAQRRLAADSSVVMEGRDIGTVVFPDARVKVFLDADAGTRAQRRVAQLRARGSAVDAAVTATEIADRDTRDRTRTEAPLMQAPDAVYLDSTAYTLDQVVEAVLRLVRERTANGKEVSK